MSKLKITLEDRIELKVNGIIMPLTNEENEKELLKYFLKKHFPESTISNWVDNEDRISDQEAMTAIELFYKFLLGEK